jgi:hypothetical protein
LTPSPALIPLQPLVTLYFVECYIGPKGPASTIMELIIIIIIIVSELNVLDACDDT